MESCRVVSVDHRGERLPTLRLSTLRSVDDLSLSCSFDARTQHASELVEVPCHEHRIPHAADGNLTSPDPIFGEPSLSPVL